MEMVKVKTAELTGPALDWAVAQAVKPIGFVMRECDAMDPPWVLGIADIPDERKCRILEIKPEDIDIDELPLKGNWAPSRFWSQGGPLIEKHSVGFSLFNDEWLACADETNTGCGIAGSGPTHLIAVCRAIVATKLGDEVEVPQDLISSQG